MSSSSNNHVSYCIFLISFDLSFSGECTGGYKDGSLKLLNELAPPQNAQPIQICFGNTWVYICYQVDSDIDDKWDYKEAIVACRQLGYKSGSK